MGSYERTPSQMSNSSYRSYAPYFPRAEASNLCKDKFLKFPPRPAEFRVSDTTNYACPLSEYDASIHKNVYASGRVPAKPPGFADAYLSPTLSQNEHLRLTMLWYHTKGITEDRELYVKLQETLDKLREFMGWHFAILGIIDEASYVKLAASNLPMGSSPRREGPCSHTINQAPGTIFSLPKMASDWRFENSPIVKLRGLRSYAGTQLRIKTEDGQDVCLGSLCVASPVEREPLTPSQEATLVWFADVLTEEIVNRTRRRRQIQRRLMAESLNTLRLTTHTGCIETKVMSVVSQIYSEAQVNVLEPVHGFLRLDETIHMALEEVQDGLWEDSGYIDSRIYYHNDQMLKSNRPVRAVVGRCGRSSKYLVLSSSSIQTVYDDFDAWFIENCGLVIAEGLESQALKEALEAKQAFLRGITHQLRTPIHGILGSADLLAEELSLMDRAKLDPGLVPAAPTLPLSHVATIKSSGRELMSTVNNILKLNAWSDNASLERKPVIYALDQLESDVLNKVFEVLPEEGLEEVSIMFKSELAPGTCVEIVEPLLLVECLQSLVMNAIQSTTTGTVTVTTKSSNTEYSGLIFDIVDTGHGIPPADQERIFEAYQKTDHHRPGAGLGLTLSVRMAKLLSGSVKLVSSEIGRGSHFRVEFVEMYNLCRKNPDTIDEPKQTSLKKVFHVLQSLEPSHMVSHLIDYLDKRGFQNGRSDDASMIILPPGLSVEDCRKQLSSVVGDRLIVCVHPSNKVRCLLEHLKYGPRTLYLYGPFYTGRLDQFLSQADKKYHDLVVVQTITPALDGLFIRAENRVTGPPIPQQPTLTAAPQLPAQTSMALLVDDNPINLKILRMYCEKRKIPYVTAQDGHEAIEQYSKALATNPISLVLMDLQMPNCDGITACKEIRAIEARAGLARSTIYIITGQDSREDRSSSLDGGADVFLVKPVSIKTLDRQLCRENTTS